MTCRKSIGPWTKRERERERENKRALALSRGKHTETTRKERVFPHPKKAIPQREPLISSMATALDALALPRCSSRAFSAPPPTTVRGGFAHFRGLKPAPILSARSVRSPPNSLPTSKRSSRVVCEAQDTAVTGHSLNRLSLRFPKFVYVYILYVDCIYICCYGERLHPTSRDESDVDSKPIFVCVDVVIVWLGSSGEWAEIRIEEGKSETVVDWFSCVLKWNNEENSIWTFKYAIVLN